MDRPAAWCIVSRTRPTCSLTIEEILGLASLSQFDYFGRPLRDIWRKDPDLRPYVALVPAVNLDEVNPASTREARESARLDLRFEDVAEEELFNHILWRTIKGSTVPYPGTRRIPFSNSRAPGRLLHAGHGRSIGAIIETEPSSRETPNALHAAVG